MVARSILVLASAAAVAQAIQITAPSNSSGWNTHGWQLIQWTVSPLSDQLSSTLAFLFQCPHALHYTNADYIIQSVITDAQNFTIAISKPNSSSRTNIVTTLVNTTDDSYIYMPSSDLKAGDGYRISFTSPDGGILAQSGEFSITDGTS